MSVLVVTSLGDIVVDLHTDRCPLTCKNFLKLCKIKYYNGCLFHTVQKDFTAQTGDPTGTGSGGDSVYKYLYGDQARFFGDEIHLDLKHSKMGTIAMASAGENLNASQFYMTLRDDLDYLDGKHTVFGEVAEGLETLSRINEAYVDEKNRPYKNIRIKHTYILDDPFEDPPQLAELVPDASPQGKPKDEVDDEVRLEDDWVPMEDQLGAGELEEVIRAKEAHSRAVVLESIGDIPDAEVKPPDNVLFVCKLNPVTEDEDLHTIFSRFGTVGSAEIIRDFKTGDSLCYAFVEFDDKEACEQAYFKMDNALIDDRRIHVDFSQSVSKLWNQYRRKGSNQANGGKGCFKCGSLDHIAKDCSGDAKQQPPKYILKDDGGANDTYDMVFDEPPTKRNKHHQDKKEEKEEEKGVDLRRTNYFVNLQKGVLPESIGRLPKGHQATSLLELMTIRASHSKILRCYSLGTAIGFRIRRGVLTDIPAILVFVSRKVHKQWLSPIQCLPTILEGPGSVWCDVDVVEFSYFGAPEPSSKEQLYTDIVDDLRGSGSCIGSGSQVASQETYGTLGAIVRSQTGNRQVGFLTNRHVAVNLDYPNQKMFHPLPPTLGPGIYLGAVERATSFITDDLWYGIFAGINPETFVRADGAFIPFSDDFDMSTVTTSVKDVGEIGDVKIVDLQSPINSLIGKKVMKVGRSSGLTKGTILAYALEYNDEKGICFFTDFLVVGENQQTFDLEGDSGSLIVLKGEENEEQPRPIGIIWGGTANRGRLKLKVGQPPENWTSGVDLGRLLNLLELDLITTSDALKAAVQEQRAASATLVGSSGGESSPPEIVLPKDEAEPLGLHIQQHIPSEEGGGGGGGGPDINLSPAENLEVGPSIEHQFIPSFNGQSPLHRNERRCRADESENLSALKSGTDEDLGFSLHLGDNDPPKRRRSDPLDEAK